MKLSNLLYCLIEGRFARLLCQYNLPAPLQNLTAFLESQSCIDDFTDMHSLLCGTNAIGYSPAVAVRLF